MNKEFLELVDEYVERFDEVFPLMELRGYSDKELIKMIKKALKDNEPIKNEQDEDVLY